MASATASQRWLYGPLPDLMLGCGLGYVAVFVLQAVAGPELRALLPLGLMPLVALVSGGPHYGATLLRVYERREDRRAYSIFAVWVSLALAVLFVAGLHSVVVGSWLLTIYLTWSPWHYSGQNYGIALMFLRRRGVTITPVAKRMLHASFVLSFLLTVLAVHGAHSVGNYAPSPYGTIGYRFIGLGIPSPIVGWGFGIFGAAYAISLLIAGGMLLRRASLRDLGPAVVIVATQALWFSVPTVVRHSGALRGIGSGIEPLSVQHLSYAILWIAVGHAVQYLWVSSYYARRSGTARRLGPYLLKVLLAGAAIWGLPALIFAPGALGRMPFESGLYILIASVINIHHFVLDGAIWKLRDGRVARILIRGGAGETPEPIGPSRRLRIAPGVWVAGAGCLAVTGLATLEYEFGVKRAFERHDAERVARATQRLAWLGQDGPSARARLGWLRARGGQWEEGVREVEKSIALFATADGWSVRGSIYAMGDRPDEAIASYREALRLSPGFPDAANNLAWLLATHPDPRLRNPLEAVELAETASRDTRASEAHALDTLAAAYAAAERFDDARREAARAHRLAVSNGKEELAREIEGRQRLYAAGRPYLESPRP